MSTSFTPQMATLVIALGLLFSLMCYLITNLSPGGMITPGWLGLMLVEDPSRVLMIAVITLATYVGSTILQKYVILYGKRLFAAVVLLGVFLQATVFLLIQDQYPLLFSHQTLGFIVPGLIAYQLIRQPRVATAMATGAVALMTYTIVLSGLLLDFLPSL